MNRGNHQFSDRRFRAQARKPGENDPTTQEERRRRQIRSWIILISVVLLVVLGIRFLGGRGKREISAARLPCYANQNVTPFEDGVLYYDGSSLHFLSSTGTIRWSFPAGSETSFSAGPHHVAIWSGSQIYIVDARGSATYNESMEARVQFARVGERYAAIIIGNSDTEPRLIVKDFKGIQVDLESDAFSGLMMLDVGFYGEQGEYLWTLALDVFGTAANTVMNTFQVGKMNTGEVSLGSALTYAVVYENARLRVFTTQQMYTYDYKAVPDTNSTMLVYGWKLIDHEIPERGPARMLLAPTSQTSSAQQITELRVLEGTTDKRYTLPDRCVGACMWRGNIYAFSDRFLYRADVNSQRFFVSGIPVPDNTLITAFYGVTSDGRAILAAGETVYSLALPR